jgi:hypothetical protein
MLLKETCPVLLSAVKLTYLSTLIGKTRQTIYNYLNCDIDDLPYRVVVLFTELEEVFSEVNNKYKIKRVYKD